MLTDPEPLLPTRGYRVLCHDATLIDFGAEGMWPRAQLEWTITSLVIGLLRQRGSQANDVRRHHVCGACHWLCGASTVRGCGGRSSAGCESIAGRSCTATGSFSPTGAAGAARG